ncbi:MAG: CPBP family intramembrane metalloprotease [Deltaproteobacteria bacterium]|nr:CPBP family intramembrane metalloprotease [Deltaproteobacteria bacterium]
MNARHAEGRSTLIELSLLVPVFFAPVTWWLAFRALRARQEAGVESASGRVTAARRLVALASVDTAIGFVVLLAKGTSSPRFDAEVPLLEPHSPFEPIFTVDCRELWHDQLVFMLWPVALGCLFVAALWARARWRDREHAGRWGLVVVPMAVAPLVGMGTAQLACERSGGWSIGVGLLGVIAQGIAMLALGGLAMRLARDELRVVVGPRLPTARTTGLGALFMLSGLARIALLVVSLWSLVPELHQAHDGGLDVMLAGEQGPHGRALVLFAAVLIAPAAEEVLFRGLLLPGLAHSMRPRAALLLSSAVFGLFHVPSHGTAAVLPGVLGMAFGWARLRSGGLKAPIALHIANNLLVTLLTWATW